MFPRKMLNFLFKRRPQRCRCDDKPDGLLDAFDIFDCQKKHGRIERPEPRSGTINLIDGFIVPGAVVDAGGDGGGGGE